MGRAIDKRGEGVHTVAMSVDDLSGTIKALKENGVQLIGRASPGGQVFIHPRSAHGVLVQLVARD